MSLLPSNVNSRIDGPLEHDDDERVAVAAELDVLEESGLKQRARRLRAARRSSTVSPMLIGR